MIEYANPEAVRDFMSSWFRIPNSEDLRGVLFIPDQYADSQASKDHVGVAYAWHGFMGRTCNISIVVQKKECLTLAVVKKAFEYPFEVCGLEAVYAMVDSTNHNSMSMCNRVGFRAVHRTPHGGIHGDLIIFEMLRANCRWLKRTH